MGSHQFFHEITIARSPEAVFAYVTNPNQWHEWFPSIQPVPLDVDGQQAGSEFQLTVAQRPLRPLPIVLTRQMHCVVSKSDPPYLWELEASSDLVDAITSYTLSRSGEGTIFKRQFRYLPKGWLRYAEPLLFRRRVVAEALQSLDKMRRHLERAD